MNPMSILGSVARNIAPMLLSAVPGGAAINVGLGVLSSVMQGQNDTPPTATGTAATGSQNVSSGFEF